MNYFANFRIIIIIIFFVEIKEKLQLFLIKKYFGNWVLYIYNSWCVHPSSLFIKDGVMSSLYIVKPWSLSCRRRPCRDSEPPASPLSFSLELLDWRKFLLSTYGFFSPGLKLWTQSTWNIRSFEIFICDSYYVSSIAQCLGYWPSPLAGQNAFSPFSDSYIIISCAD